MIKLYNYEEKTLIYKRTLELEKMPDEYEFCTLTEIPEYDIHSQYLKYDKITDQWVVNNIEISEKDIESAKFKKIAEIKSKTTELIQNKYGGYFTQFNIVNLLGGYTIEKKTEYENFVNSIISQGLSQQIQIQNLTAYEAIKNFKIQFLMEE